MAVREYLNSFKGRLFLLILGAILVPLVVSNLILGAMLEKQFRSIFHNRLEAGGESLSLLLSNRRGELIRGLERMASDNTLQVTLDLEIVPQLNKYIVKQQKVLQFEGLGVADKDGVMIASTGPTGGLEVLNPSPVPLVRLLNTENRCFFSSHTPVKKNGEIIGYVVGALPITNTSFMEALKNGFAVWVDGKPAASSLDTERIPYGEKMPGTGVVEDFSAGGEDYKIMVKSEDVSGRLLSYGILLPLDQLRESLLMMVFTVCGVVFAVFIMIMLVLRRFIRELIKPVTQLTSAASAIESRSDKIPELDYKRQDEFGILNRTFRNMYLAVTKYIEDIRETQLRQAELMEAANQASKAKDEFLANMSHELRTPMNAIVGMTDIVLCSPLGKEQRDYVEIIKKAADEMTLLIRDILDFSTIDSGELKLREEGFNLKSLATQVVSGFLPQAEEKGLFLKVIMDREVPSAVIGDQDRLTQVLVNILGNAVKFTSEGGILFEMGVSHNTHKETFVRFSISDTGDGIPEKYRKHVFEAFSQVDGSYTRHYGGTGLGLAISAGLIDKMGGRITVQSPSLKQIADNGGPGSTFVFSIALKKQKQADPEMVPEPAGHHVNDQDEDCLKVFEPEDSRGGQLKVLLAEDEEMNQVSTVKMLNLMGCTVTVAKNGAEAVRAYMEEVYDCILMDGQMPVMDGFEATSEIREIERDSAENRRVSPDQRIPIIAVTANAMAGDRELYIAAGMDDYLAKPFTKDSLEDAIRRNLASRGKKTSGSAGT